MLNVPVLVKRLHPHAKLPIYAQAGNHGADVFSVEEHLILPGHTEQVSTGIAIACDPDFECQFRTRPGLALNHSISILNSPGTINPGCRGEIRAILHNHGVVPYQVRVGDKIGQFVVVPVHHGIFTEVDELPKTVADRELESVNGRPAAGQFSAQEVEFMRSHWLDIYGEAAIELPTTVVAPAGICH